MMLSGHKVQFGVDTLANPALINGRTVNIDSVNRMYRGGYNDTRLPFQLLNLDFESETSRDKFRYGSLTSIKGYNGVPPFSRSHIVVTVGKCIFVGQINGNTAYMKLLYEELDETLLHQFPVQAESLMLFNNGKTTPVYWNGQTDEIKPITESQHITDPDKLVPIGNIAVYAHGRLWIATEDGVVYAGDHLYSQGIFNTGDDVLFNFTESFYPESGDGFTAPAEWGDLRGMAVMPRDPSTNGHGEIIVMHLNGAYSVNPIDDRNTWTNQNIQQTVFTGQGGCSPWSIATINNDLLFRASDKRIKSFRQTIAQRTQQLQIRPISNEVSKYLDFDSFDNLRFSMHGIEDERLLFSVNHQVIDNKLYGGKHRFGNGIVCCDFSSGTNVTPDNLSWDGLWTGPRVTGITQMLFGTERKSVFSSYDRDGINRLYMLSRFRGDDIINEGQSKIVSMYVTGNMFDGIAVDGKEVAVTTISNHVTYYSDCVGGATIAADYNSSFSDNWYKLYDKQTIGLEPSNNNVLFDVAANRFNSPTTNDSVTENTGRRVISGVTFNVRIKLEGSVMIRAALLTGDTSPDKHSFLNECKETADYRVDSYDYFQYQF